MNIRILSSNTPENLKEEMEAIGVSSYGIGVMQPKANSFLIKLEDVDFRAANILKQEMLSLDGEAAIPKGALDRSVKETAVILIGNQRIFSKLPRKLSFQPFGLKNIGIEVDSALKDYALKYFTIKGKQLNLKLGRKTAVMGILNVTPDSFYDGGKYYTADRAVERAQEMLAEGADIIDLGGESTRPGARPVPLKEELNRVIPVIKRLRKKMKAPISIDTYKSEVAREALDSGADLVNDITSLRGDRKMARLLAKRNIPVILMHMQGAPRTMQKRPVYKSVTADIIKFLKVRIKEAVTAGINSGNIIVDPGIGFGKSIEHNLEIFRRLKEFKVLGRPILIGPSRKSMIGRILDVSLKDRFAGTAALAACSILNGAHIIRVHDVKEMVRLVRMVDAVKGRQA